LLNLILAQASDNLPFFGLVAAVSSGRTLIHDWVYENRATYLTELNRLGGKVLLADPHRVFIEGPTIWHKVEMDTPPALRPAMVIMLAMLIPRGKSILKNVYVIKRGYENIAKRFKELGARIKEIEA
jgi:UDP-N-acetylglucosamine 1-carboxyvinyltransferase